MVLSGIMTLANGRPKYIIYQVEIKEHYQDYLYAHIIEY